jgi:hypothetical protein
MFYYKKERKRKKIRQKQKKCKILPESILTIPFYWFRVLFGNVWACHLKIQKLTIGKVICKFGSFLEIRHMSHAVSDKKSIIIDFLSSEPYVSQNEKHLVCSIKKAAKVR